MNEEIKKLAQDETFGLENILRQLDAGPVNVTNAGVKVDKLRKQQIAVFQRVNDAKSALAMMEATAAMNMPDTATNDMKRKAYVTNACAPEKAMVELLECEARSFDSDIMDANRSYQFQQDILTSTQKKAEVITAALRFLSAR